MTKVDIKLYDRDYAVSCGAGEEPRLKEVVRFVDQKMRDIAKRAPSASESRLLMLTCLLLADELLETRRQQNTAATADHSEEDLMVAAVDHLRDRVEKIAKHVGKA